MFEKCKSRIICLLIIVILSTNIFATPIIYTKNDINIGPGIQNNPIQDFNNLVYPLIDNLVQAETVATNSITSTESETQVIYEHDGIKYIKGENMGSFALTGYCACKKCTNGSGITASGKPVRENHTVSADKTLLPLGTVIILENAKGKDGTIYDGVYVVEDIGGGVKNKHIDIYRPTHDLAALVTYYGRAYGDVYIAIPFDDE